MYDSNSLDFNFFWLKNDKYLTSKYTNGKKNRLSSQRMFIE